MKNIVHAPGSPLQSVVEQCGFVAQSDATVLLHGETGTGKEIFARYIHTSSKRAGAFVAVNCGAIPDNLIEAELFGHVRGAFTGADKVRKGRVAAAENGTLFLDEIGELPLALQVKLLRLLQERTYEPVGDSEPIAANFRLIAATNKNLEVEVAAGRFRRDLYYRLFVCPIELPPLRARVDDVDALFAHFWAARGETRSVDAAVLTYLRAYPWPGNVRELENVVERLAVCSQGDTIAEADLPALYRARPKLMQGTAVGTIELPTLPSPTPGALLPMNLSGLLREIEAAYIDAALAQTSGNRQAAASLLGLQRTTLVEKLRRRQLALAPGDLSERHPSAGDDSASSNGNASNQARTA